MNELLILIGIILIVIGIVAVVIHFFLHVTQYYKQKFGVKMGPSILTMCLAIDLLVIAALLYGNQASENWILIFNGASLVCFVICIMRNIKYYKKSAVGAIAVQSLFGLLQLLLFVAALITIVLRSVIKRQSDQMRMILGWTKLILNM